MSSLESPFQADHELKRIWTSMLSSWPHLEVGIIPASLAWNCTHCVPFLLLARNPKHHNQTHNCNRFLVNLPVSPLTLGKVTFNPILNLIDDNLEVPACWSPKSSWLVERHHPSLYTKYQLSLIKQQSSTVLCRPSKGTAAECRCNSLRGSSVAPWCVTWQATREHWAGNQEHTTLSKCDVASFGLRRIFLCMRLRDVIKLWQFLSDIFLKPCILLIKSELINTPSRVSRKVVSTSAINGRDPICKVWLLGDDTNFEFSYGKYL